MSTKVNFNTQISTAIKGFALLLMIIHHCFGFPDWYVNSINYSGTTILGSSIADWTNTSCKICLGLFAFISGWAYSYKKDFAFNYSVKKIINILKYYWIILFLIFLPIAIHFSGYTPTVTDIIENIFSLNNNLVCFAWYVHFYIISMLILPLLVKLTNENKVFNITFPILCCVAIYNIANAIHISNAPYIMSDIAESAFWFPCIWIGYCCHKYDFFSILDKTIKHKSIIVNFIVILLILGIRIQLQNFHNLNLDIIYTPIVIFELVNIFSKLNSVVTNSFMFLGHQSLNIWFLHSIFFSYATKEIFQPIAYIPKNPVLVVIWVILLCIPFSLVTNFIINLINKLINNSKDNNNDNNNNSVTITQQ